MPAKRVSDLSAQLNDVVAPARRAFDKVSELNARRSAPLILELDLTEHLAQGPPPDRVEAFMQRHRVNVKDVLAGLRRAAKDNRVRALLVKVGQPRMGLASVQELRDAVIAFRRSGKPAVAWAETFGEWGPGTVPYYLATAFDEIWLQPIGDVTLNGVTLGATFLRGALDRLHVEPQLGQRYEYKNAADALMRSSFSEPHREALDRIATSAFDEVVAGIAQARGLSPDRVRDLVDRAPLPAAEALAEKLVDRLGYRDEVYADVRRRAGSSARLQYVARYVQPSPAAAAASVSRHERTVALIWGSGAIVTGKGARRPGGGQRIASDTMSATFRAAARDERVDAIVFRVDSPGGSAIASDVIWREVQAAQRAGKPVVVSMGNVAGSGGYYVAMGADAIVAEPATITGSIGVLAGKLVTDGLWNRLGVTYDSVAIGEMARMFSTRRTYTEAEWAALERLLDRLYEAFVGKVAEGRRMSRDDVHALAKGRIWTGADAKERGLVDALGGLELAVDLAIEKAAIPATAGVALVTYPRVPPVARVVPPQSSESPGAADARLGTAIADGWAASFADGWGASFADGWGASFADGWGAFAALAERLGMPAAGPLSMPWVPTWT